jgi:hypothetical protein
LTYAQIFALHPKKWPCRLDRQAFFQVFEFIDIANLHKFPAERKNSLLTAT